MIDLRSDTVTKLTEEMRKAAYEAEVGDDVYGEDPTVQKLEETAAEILGYDVNSEQIDQALYKIEKLF